LWNTAIEGKNDGKNKRKSEEMDSLHNPKLRLSKVMVYHTGKFISSTCLDKKTSLWMLLPKITKQLGLSYHAVKLMIWASMITVVLIPGNTFSASRTNGVKVFFNATRCLEKNLKCCKHVKENN
jgi:hypothetical protein